MAGCQHTASWRAGIQSLGQVFALGFKHLAAAVLFENYVVGSPE